MSENIDFNEITKDDILKAFKKYDELKENNELPRKRKQKDYILFYNSKEYPHKYIVGIAYGLKHNKEPLDNDLYSSTGKYKRSAQQCIEKNGFELYSDTKYKKYLESKYSNKITIGTYYSDLKKAIKIFQNIPILNNKSLSALFKAMENGIISFAEYDKSQKELGFDDKQLFSTLKTKAKTYQEALQWEERKFINAEVTLYKQIAEKYSLRLHVSSGLKYVQIYPKVTPENEGVNGCHYEYYIKDNAIYFTLHLENKTYKKEKLQANIVKVFEKDKIATIQIDNDFSNERIIEEFDKLYNQVEKIITMHYKSNTGEQYMQYEQPLNQILYGPPGTGKTYNTINKALEIIFEKDPNGELKTILGKETNTVDERKQLKATFEKYKELGQIEFVTFHQSYGYEEFVEGIKADLECQEIKYKLEAGIFKKLSIKAEKDYSNLDFTKYIKPGDEIKAPRSTFTVVKVQNDRITVRIKNSNTEDILRKNVVEYLKLGTFGSQDAGSNMTYAPAIAKYIFENLQKNTDNTDEKKNYILIIDEINRGNISKIFGELITLIEPSKRMGKDEEIQVKLSNSGELFGVPNNLYIIGTMNTADRSIAQIDTALRRRFEFIEIMPKVDLLQAINIDEIEVDKILEAMNERIEYLYDREHTIGHSYFMSLLDNTITNKKAKLDEIFRVNIIPLLAEYFYSDWEDIKIILNDTEDNGAFITKKSVPKYSIDSSKMNNKVYVVNKNFGDINSYKKIYDAEQE